MVVRSAVETAGEYCVYYTYKFQLDEVAAAAADDAQNDGAALRRHETDSELIAASVRQLIVGKRVDDEAAVVPERVCHALYTVTSSTYEWTGVIGSTAQHRRLD